VIELLEDALCERVLPFALWSPSQAWLDANPTADADRRWVRVTGAGADVQAATGACDRIRARSAHAGLQARMRGARCAAAP
jgi:hypothetical protein